MASASHAKIALYLWRWRGVGPARRRYGLVVAADHDTASKLVTDLGVFTFALTTIPWPDHLKEVKALYKPFAIEQKRG